MGTEKDQEPGPGWVQQVTHETSVQTMTAMFLHRPKTVQGETWVAIVVSRERKALTSYLLVFYAVKSQPLTAGFCATQVSHSCLSQASWKT